MNQISKKRGFSVIIMWCFQYKRFLKELKFTITFMTGMKIKHLLFTLMILQPVFTFSQVQITGRVLDTEGKAVSYANVLILEASTEEFVKGNLTNESGDFSVKILPDSLILKISFIGYKTWSDTLNIYKDTNVGKIILEEDATALNEVIIEGTKPMIERKVDRMIFNVEQSISAKGGSGTDVLKVAPLLRVDDAEGISIVGKNDVSVMINDRMLNMSGDQLVNYLNSIRADDISKIEVITTPPAKYDAQGNSGIINIILKDKTIKGWSGNLTSTYMKKTYDNYLSNFNLNYKGTKISSSLKLRYTDKKINSYEKTSIEGDRSVFSLDERIDEYKNIGANYSLDYKISEKSNVGFVYDFEKNQTNLDVNNSSLYETGGIKDSLLLTNAIHEENANLHTISSYYHLKLDTLNKELNIGLNYFSNDPDNTINFQTRRQESDNPDNFESNSKLDYSIYSGRVDLSLPYNFGRLETGTKFTYFENKSSLKFYNFQEIGGNQNAPNIFDYQEKNYAGYISFDKNINEKWSSKVGIRYEYSDINALSNNSGEPIDYNYGEWFPTAYISYKPNNINTFNINYSRRINRPSFRSLNPNRWYINPYSYSQGNPLLKPSFSNNLEFGYAFKNLLFFDFYHQKTEQAYSQLVEFQNGVRSIVYQNMYDQNNFGINVGYYDTFFRFWDISLNSNFSYSKNESTIQQVSGQEGYNFSYDINNTLSLNDEKTIILNASFKHMLPGVYGILRTRGFTMLNIGGQFSLIEDKLQLNISLQDIFKGAVTKGYANYTNYISRIENYYDYRGVSLSLSYKFGNKKIKESNKNIDFNEKQRAN